MKLFFHTQWGAHDGLSVATVHPHLKILAGFEQVEHIYYFSTERPGSLTFKAASIPTHKITHFPIHVRKLPLRMATQIGGVLSIRKTLLKKFQLLRPDAVICRGAPAGTNGYRLHKRFGIDYYVESFEPHAEYMAESGVWDRNGLKYRYQSSFEERIKATATGILTVSENYRRYLIETERLPAGRVYTMPCAVDLKKFAFNPEKRDTIRQHLGIHDQTVVGVYLGKFGGIYYNEPAFRLFKQSLDFFEGKFHLILLSPEPKESLEERLRSAGFALDRVLITVVAHEEVPHYLSAADFAFNLHVSGRSRTALSPIKDGEYWAVGLPILLPDCIGDDSDIVRVEGGGAVIDIDHAESIREGLEVIQTILTQPEHRDTIRALAGRHRSFDTHRKVYSKILDSYGK